MRISYVNGRYLQHSEAMVSIEDRGYQFSDGVYEVIAFYNRRLLDSALHLARLKRSLRELSIAAPMSEKALRIIIDEVIARNSRTDGTVYIQISRGTARRDHSFPKAGVKPSVVMVVGGPKMPKAAEIANGVSVITVPDQRWARRDIKSISLLANVLARQQATAAGAREAWLVDGHGMMTECAVSNSYIVDAGGEVVTHPATHAILGGITRHVVLELARKAKMKIVERAFSLKEALAANEAFLTSTTSNVLPVTRIDGKPVGSGRPGPVTLKLLKLYQEHIFKETGRQWS